MAQILPNMAFENNFDELTYLFNNDNECTPNFNNLNQNLHIQGGLQGWKSSIIKEDQVMNLMNQSDQINEFSSSNNMSASDAFLDIWPSNEATSAPQNSYGYINGNGDYNLSSYNNYLNNSSQSSNNNYNMTNFQQNTQVIQQPTSLAASYFNYNGIYENSTNSNNNISNNPQMSIFSPTLTAQRLYLTPNESSCFMPQMSSQNSNLQYSPASQLSPGTVTSHTPITVGNTPVNGNNILNTQVSNTFTTAKPVTQDSFLQNHINMLQRSRNQLPTPADINPILPSNPASQNIYDISNRVSNNSEDLMSGLENEMDNLNSRYIEDVILQHDSAQAFGTNNNGQFSNLITPSHDYNQKFFQLHHHHHQHQHQHQQQQQQFPMRVELKNNGFNFGDNGMKFGSHLHIKKESLLQQLKRDPKIWAKVINKNKKGSYKCNHCPKLYSTLLDFAIHIDENNITRQHKCPVDDCPWKLIGLPRRAELRRHCVSQHFLKGKYKEDSISSNPHIRKAINDLIYTCQEQHCGKTFYRKDSLQRHKRLVHENKDSKFNKRMKKNSVNSQSDGETNHMIENDDLEEEEDESDA